MFVSISDCRTGITTNCIINIELSLESSKMQANILNGEEKICDF